MVRRASRLRIAGAAVAALVLLVSADRVPPAGRVTAAVGSSAHDDPRVPPFTLFAWVSPPPESTTQARMHEYADAGLDVALPAWADSGRREDNLARFAWAAERGVRCIAWDRRLYGVRFPDSLAALDSVVADYRDQPGFLAYYFEDEPAPETFPLWASFHAALAERDRAHFSFNNLLGRQAFPTRSSWEKYTREYVDVVHPAVLCNDQYDFLENGDRGQFVENVAGLAAIAREHGLPFWLILQLIQHGSFRAITEGELRWQMGMGLAYGARGLGIFTYWTPAPDPQWNWQYGLIDWEGRRTHWFTTLQELAPMTRAIGTLLASATWLTTEHAGPVPAGGTAFAPDDWLRAIEGRVALGAFVSSTKRLLLVANADSSKTQTVTFWFGNVSKVWRMTDADEGGHSWTPQMLEVTARGSKLETVLDAGEFTLLWLEGGGDGLVSGRGPVLQLGPVPAQSRLSFSVRELGDRGCFEILDAGGRRVWSRPLARGTAVFEWNGGTDEGGRVTPGVYFVRVEDARGVTARRFVWLGH